MLFALLRQAMFIQRCLCADDSVARHATAASQR